MKKIYYTIFTLFLTIPSAGASATTLANPLRNSADTKIFTATELVGFVIQGILGIAGVLAIAIIIWSALKIVIGSQQGNESMIGDGKKGLLYAVIGLILAFLGYIVVNLIIETLVGSLSG